MTDERKITDMAVDVDETVSRAYREVADESAPERLNQAILGQARKAARPRYARSRAWTRPLAWAATVALSVAVVLEVMQLPTPDGVSFDKVGPEADVQRDAPLDALEEEVPAAIAPGRTSNFVAQPPEKSDLMRRTAAKSEPVFEERKREASEKMAEPAPAIAAPASADELAETQYKDRDESVRTQSFALSSSIAACPDELTREPSTWLECIEELEAAGRSDEASEQRRLLRETFPDFESP